MKTPICTWRTSPRPCRSPVNHPAVYEIVYPDADYFALTEYSEEYTFDGQSAALTFWHDHCTP